MRVVDELSVPAFPGERAVITIGAYDGVHLGHQAVIGEVRRQAATIGARSVVVTFDRHPASVVRPESAPKLLTDLDQKLELLAATGVDATAVVHFDHEMSQLAPLEFVQRVLVDCLRTSLVVVGDDFHFGHNREGNVSSLREFGARADFDVLPMSLVARTDGPDEPISFDKQIKPLFRGRDQQSMKFAFDLWSYDDVKANAQAILERLDNGTMPCDGAWPAEQITAFKRWLQSGMSP